MHYLFAGYAQVTNDDGIVLTKPAMAVAGNIYEAVGILVGLARDHCPVEDGFTGHTAEVALIGPVTIHTPQPEPKQYFSSVPLLMPSWRP